MCCVWHSLSRHVHVCSLHFFRVLGLQLDEGLHALALTQDAHDTRHALAHLADAAWVGNLNTLRASSVALKSETVALFEENPPQLVQVTERLQPQLRCRPCPPCSWKRGLPVLVKLCQGHEKIIEALCPRASAADATHPSRSAHAVDLAATTCCCRRHRCRTCQQHIVPVAAPHHRGHCGAWMGNDARRERMLIPPRLLLQQNGRGDG
mmetsp:Transcript_78963/g.128013  ORF Transcript_78963/g.128013 Transcript_78963/m.128013 type:complete len:208 (-) Transcript_78963:105-728(-)